MSLVTVRHAMMQRATHPVTLGNLTSDPESRDFVTGVTSVLEFTTLNRLEEYLLID